MHSVDVLYICAFRTRILCTALFPSDKSAFSQWHKELYMWLTAPALPPCSFICRRWRGGSSRQSRPAFRDRAYVCSSLGQSQQGFPLGPVCSLPCVSLSVCVSCPDTLCVSCSLCHLAFSATPSFAHTPFPPDCVPCPSPCFCRLNMGDHCSYVLAASRGPCRAQLYVCPHCTVQTSIDSIYIPASAIPPSVPCCSLR